MATLPLLDDFLLNLKVNNYSDKTQYNYERDLRVFENFLSDAKLTFSQLKKKDILNYKAFLYSVDRLTPKNHKGLKKLSSYSTNRMLSALRSYLRYLIDMDCKVPVAPDTIKMAKTTKKKAQVAELDELIALLESPTKYEENQDVGIRNRAILEMLFSTGMRISELVNLRMDRIDKKGKVFILGKGKKERFVYLTPRAIKHLLAYMKIRSGDSPFVFVPFGGAHAKDKNKKLSTNYIQERIKRYREYLGINVPTSAHSLRHGFATYLAESGANPAAIQTLLGHESLDTTTRYVHTSDRYAQSEQSKFHPLKS